MSLRLVKAGAPLPPQVAIRPLSHAREALAKHLAAMGAVRVEHERLSKFRTTANDAQRVLDDANEALDAVADIERQQWLDWVSAGGRTPSPQPMSEERAARATIVAEATARRDFTLQRAEAIQPAAKAAWETFIALSQQRPALIAAVLLEEAQSLAHGYEQLCRQAIEHEVALNALRSALLRIDQGQRCNDISLLLRLAAAIVVMAIR